MHIKVVSVASDLALGVIKCHVGVTQTVSGEECHLDTVKFYPHTKTDSIDNLNAFIAITTEEAVRNFSSRFYLTEGFVTPAKPKPVEPSTPVLQEPEIVEQPPVTTAQDESDNSSSGETVPPVAVSEASTPAVEVVAPAVVEAPMESDCITPNRVEEVYVKGTPSHAAAARDGFTEALVAVEGLAAKAWSGIPRYKAAAAAVVQFLQDSNVVVLVDGERSPDLANIMVPVVRKALEGLPA